MPDRLHRRTASRSKTRFLRWDGISRRPSSASTCRNRKRVTGPVSWRSGRAASPDTSPFSGKANQMKVLGDQLAEAWGQPWSQDVSWKASSIRSAPEIPLYSSRPPWPGGGGLPRFVRSGPAGQQGGPRPNPQRRVNRVTHPRETGRRRSRKDSVAQFRKRQRVDHLSREPTRRRWCSRGTSRPLVALRLYHLDQRRYPKCLQQPARSYLQLRLLP
jgi:hypothetical protein